MLQKAVIPHGVIVEDDFWRSTEGAASRREIIRAGDDDGEDREGDDDEWETPLLGARGGGGSTAASDRGPAGGGSSGATAKRARGDDDSGGEGGSGGGGGGSGGGASTKRARGEDAVDTTGSRGHAPGRSPGGGRVYYGLMRTTVVGRQRHVPAGKQLHKVLAGELVWVQHDTVGGKYPHGVAVLGGPAAGAPESRVKLGFIQSVCSEFLARVLQLPPTAKIQCIARVDGDDINDFNFDVAIEVRTQYSAAIALRHTETSTALLYCPWPNLCTTTSADLGSPRPQDC